MKKYLLYILTLFISITGYTQVENVKKSPLQGFNISGNYRFYAQHRIFTQDYAIDIVNNEPVFLGGRSILIGDATQLPELTLNINGNPTSKTTFGTDLIIWNQNTGDFDYYRNLLLGVNLYGGFNTDIGNFNIRAGGLHWHKMTPFTMKAFEGYNRFSLFERNPWDPQFKNINSRYEEYYNRGAITQDQRWGSQALQGFILDITELPFGLAANVLYGKTQNAGAFLNDIPNDPNDSTANSFIKFYENTLPSYVYGGRLIKSLGETGSISLNTFNQKAYKDYLALEPIDNHLITSDFNISIKNKVNFSGEVGMGKYMDLDAGEMASLKLRFDKKLTKIPFEIHTFHISPNVVNNNGEFVNTSVNEVTPASGGTQEVIGSNGVLMQTGSAMLGVGQMANNRQGINLNTDIKIKDLTITLGNGIAREIENLTNQVTYIHAINGLTMARFWRWAFPQNVGPYGRKSVLFRGVFENVYLNDLSENGEVINKKHFNNLEAQIKYKRLIFGKEWYIFYLGSYASVQPNLSPITVFNENAYIRLYSHQLENYYHVHSKLILAQYLGWERVIGNYKTTVDLTSKRPRNQEGLSVGFGIDYMMAKNTGLYLRHRWFSFEDRSFELDKFAGHESTVEVKIYF